MFVLFALFAKQISVELFKITNVPTDFFPLRQKKPAGGGDSWSGIIRTSYRSLFYILEQPLRTWQLHIRRITFHRHFNRFCKYLKDRLYLMVFILPFRFNIQIAF